VSDGPCAVRAVIFDLDGVLVDTEPIHHRAMRAFVAPGELTDAQYASLVGGGIDNTMRWIRDTYRRPETLAELRAAYHDAVWEHLAHAHILPLAGVREAIDSVRARGLPLAVASQSAPAWVRAALRASGLARTFDAIVTADAVPRAKPAPDIYLHTAMRLRVDPRGCVAIEDSVPGVASARAAGMRVVQTRQTTHAAPPQPGALVLQTMRTFDLDALCAGRA